MSFFRALYRFFLFLTIVVYHISWIFWRGVFKGRDMHAAITIRRKMSMRLANALGVETELEGDIPEHGILGVTNHRSYVDSVAIFAHKDASVVVKAEVGKWPIIGYGLKVTYTVLVDRQSKESRRRTREQIRELLENDVSVIIFVEGTTYRGPEAGEFRPGTFITAAEGGFQVVPIAIEYENQDIAWIDDDSFLPHFFKIFGENKKIRCKVRFGPVMIGEDGLELRDRAHAWVSEQLMEMRAEYDAVLNKKEAVAS